MTGGLANQSEARRTSLKKTYPRFCGRPHTRFTSPRRYDGQSRDRLKIGGEWLVERLARKGVTARGPSGANRPAINAHAEPTAGGVRHLPCRTGRSERQLRSALRRCFFLRIERHLVPARSVSVFRNAGAHARGD